MTEQEYTPTTEEVRDRFIDGFPIDTWVVARDSLGEEFDRWLAEHDRQVKAEALEAAATATSNAANGAPYEVWAWCSDWLRARAAEIREGRA